MLILRRRAGDAIMIGDNVEVEVVEITSGRVTLGFKAPVGLRILRKELLLTRDQNIAAAQGLSGEGLEALVGRLRQLA